jgi:hypothetical protein
MLWPLCSQADSLASDQRSAALSHWMFAKRLQRMIRSQVGLKLRASWINRYKTIKKYQICMHKKINSVS